MARSNHQKNLCYMRDVFEEDVVELFFSLTPDAKEKLLYIAENQEVTESLVVEVLVRKGTDNAITYYKQKGFDPNEPKMFKSKNRYGQSKKHKSLSITQTASKLLNEFAASLGEPRSEALECLIRSSNIPKARKLIKQLISS